MSRPLYLNRRNRLGDVAQKQTYAGRRYHSRMEAAYAATLDQLASAADPRDRVTLWEPQYKIDLRVNGKHVCNYYVDFIVTFGDGRVEYHEVKGFETEIWKLKKALLEATRPDIALKVIR